MFEPFTTTLSAALIWDKLPDEFKKSLEEKAKKSGEDFGQKLWEKFKFHQAEKDYREKLAKDKGTTRILGNSEPTLLEGIFTDLYILDKPLAMRRYSLDDLQASNEKLYGHNIKREEGIAVVKQKDNHRLFILGKPGAGKTTFLKYITLQAVKGELPQTPIFIGLREWSEAKKKQNDKEINLTLMEFIVEQFAICNFPKAENFIEYLLEKGKAILLLDGLDEVNSEHNLRVIKAVKDFCRKYDKTQCLITCRVAAVDYSFEAFKYMEVADFTEAQVETFVKKWFVKEPIKCEKFLTEFKQEQYRGLRELASSPLLLGMLCLAFADSMEFTTRRVDIYEDAIDALLRKWDTSRSISRDVIYHGLNHQLKKRLFNAMAYKTFSDNEYLIEEHKLVDYLTYCLKKLPNTEKQELDGEIVLKAIEAQHGIFVERAQKIHSFVHLTFQEYFTACAIKGNLNYQKELMKHITDPRWREVFLLTASLLDNADDFFKFFKNEINHFFEENKSLSSLVQKFEVMTQQEKFEKSISTKFFYFSIDIIFMRAKIRFDKSNNIIGLQKAKLFDNEITCIFAIIRDSIPEPILELDRFIHLDLYMGQSPTLRIYKPNFLDVALNYETKDKRVICDYFIIILFMLVLKFSFYYNLKLIIEDDYDDVLKFFKNSINKIEDMNFSHISIELKKLLIEFPSKISS